MAGVKFKVNYNYKNINKIDKSIKNCFIEAAEKLKQDIIDAQVIPFDTGATQKSLEVNVLERQGRIEAQLSTSTNYSDRIYWHPEYNFQTKHNKNARGRWFDTWIWGTKKDDVRRYFKESLERELKK